MLIYIPYICMYIIYINTFTFMLIYIYLSLMYFYLHIATKPESYLYLLYIYLYYMHVFVFFLSILYSVSLQGEGQDSHRTTVYHIKHTHRNNSKRTALTRNCSHTALSWTVLGHSAMFSFFFFASLSKLYV